MTSLDQIIYNNGFHAVAIEIFLNMDPKSLSNCRLLSKVYKDFIDNTKPLVMLQIEQTIVKQKFIFQNIVTKYHPRNEKDYKSLISKSMEANKQFSDLCNKRLDKCDLKTVFEFMKNIWANPKSFSTHSFHKNEMNIFSYSKNYPNYHRHDIRKKKLFEDFVIVLFQLIIKDGPKLGSMNVLNFKIEDLLLLAIRNMHVVLVEKVLNFTIQTGNNFDLNGSIDKPEWLPLFEVSYMLGMNPEIVKLLLDYPSAKKIKLNSDVYTRRFQGRTPLHHACFAGSIEIVGLFLDYIEKHNKDFDFNAPDNLGNTPIHLAGVCPFYQTNVGAIVNRMLILHREKKINLNFNAQNNDGKVLIHYLAQYRQIENIANLKMVLDFSLKDDENINLNITQFWRCNILHYACLRDVNHHNDSNTVKTVKVLLEHYSKNYGKTNNINPNAQSDTGDTPLHFACKDGLYEVVKLFVDYQLANNIKNHNGLTPMEVALKNGHQEIAQLLCFNETLNFQTIKQNFLEKVRQKTIKITNRRYKMYQERD